MLRPTSISIWYETVLTHAGLDLISTGIWILGLRYDADVSQTEVGVTRKNTVVDFLEVSVLRLSPQVSRSCSSWEREV